MSARCGRRQPTFAGMPRNCRRTTWPRDVPMRDVAGTPSRSSPLLLLARSQRGAQRASSTRLRSFGWGDKSAREGYPDWDLQRTYCTREAFSRNTLESPAISGCATLLRIGGGKLRKVSSARKHESRSSSILMTSAIKRRSAATTLSLNRPLNELAEAIRRDKRSSVVGLAVYNGSVRSSARRKRGDTTHQSSAKAGPDRATTDVKTSSRKTADGSYGSCTRDAVTLICGEFVADPELDPEPALSRRRSVVARCTSSMSVLTATASASPCKSLSDFVCQLSLVWWCDWLLCSCSQDLQVQLLDATRCDAVHGGQRSFHVVVGKVGARHVVLGAVRGQEV